MPDKKISALTAGTVLADGDLFPAVDVSDTTMADSGTTKAYTFSVIKNKLRIANQIFVPNDYATPELAIEAASAGDTIIIDAGLYPSPASDTVYPNNLTIIGVGRPMLAADGNALEGGARLYGPWLIGDGATAITVRGLKIYTLGIDCGVTICATYYGGTAQEGFGTASATESGFPGFEMQDCIALCKGTTTVHAFSFEQLYNFCLSRLEGVNGAHGMAVKSQQGTISEYRSRSIGTAGGSGLIFAGASSNPCRNITATGINVFNRTYGITFQYAQSTDAHVRDIAVAGVATRDCTTGVDIQINGAGDIGPIEISAVTTRGGTAGFSVQYGSTGTAKKVRVNGMTAAGSGTGFTPLHARLSDVTAEACTIGYQLYPATSPYNSFIGWKAKECTTAINVQSASAVIAEAPTLDGNTINYGGAGTLTTLPLLFQSMQSAGAISNTASEVTTLLASTVSGGSLTVPQWVVANGSIRLRASGVYGITGTPTIIFKVYGGANAASLLLTFPTVTLNAAGSFRLDCDFKVRDPAGASSVVLIGGILVIDGESHAATSYAIIDCSVAHTFAVSVQWGTASASNTIDHYIASLSTDEFLRP